MNATDSPDRSLFDPWKLWTLAIVVVIVAVLFKSSVHVRGWLMYMPTLYRPLLFGVCLLHVVIHCAMSGTIVSSVRAGWTIALSHVALLLAILFQYDFDDVGQFWTITALLEPGGSRYLPASWCCLGLLNIVVFLPVVTSWALFLRLPRA